MSNIDLFSFRKESKIKTLRTGSAKEEGDPNLQVSGSEINIPFRQRARP